MTAVTERAATIATEAAASTSGEISAAFAEIAVRLAEPLRVAVAGPVKAGKSTLVNALLGRMAAPTDVSECTRVVTEFRYGYPERAEVVLLDGSTQALPLDRGGQLPIHLGIDPSAVAKVRVWLANDALRTMTLIDTPGLNSVNTDISARSEQLLRMDADTRWAVGGADVVIFVLTASLNAADLSRLRERYLSATGSRSPALTTLGVLTKADQIGGSGDPWVAATRLAQRHEERLSTDVAAVVPVFGLLAQTAETYALTEADAAALVELAETSSPTMLWGPDHFLADAGPVSLAQRSRLLSRLDMFGVATALTLVTEGCRGAAALRVALAERSGLAEVRRHLDDTFTRRAGGLQTLDALNRMNQLSYRGAAEDSRALTRLRARIEALTDDEDMHEVAELQALAAGLAGSIALPEHLALDVSRLSNTTGPALRCRLAADATGEQVMIAAAQRAAAWQEYATGNPGSAGQAIARVLVRTYTLIFEQAQPSAASTEIPTSLWP
jgi:50S ribosome-binding GTPase